MIGTSEEASAEAATATPLAPAREGAAIPSALLAEDGIAEGQNAPVDTTSLQGRISGDDLNASREEDGPRVSLQVSGGLFRAIEARLGDRDGRAADVADVELYIETVVARALKGP